MYDGRISKQAITEKVLAQFTSTHTSLEAAMSSWWVTKSAPSLRLTDEGELAFRLAGVEFSDVDIGKRARSWYSFISDCSKKLQCPYYLMQTSKQAAMGRVRLYDSRIVTMVGLYGDLYSYMDSIPNDRN